MSVKQEILDKLLEIETLLAEASCEGVQLAELPYFDEIDAHLQDFVEVVDYYVD